MGAAKKLTNQEQSFVRNLAASPYCCDKYADSRMRPVREAITKKHIQANRQRLTSYLIFDIDRCYAAMAWYDAHLPAPLFTTTNPENGHAHICYALSVPFSTSALSKLKIIQYAAAIQKAYRLKLNADVSYSGLLTKNPINPAWKTHWWTDYAYSFEELADYVDLPNQTYLKESAEDMAGLGRNCYLFENVRAWAYKEIREYWRPEYYDCWLNAVMTHTETLNQSFITSLPQSEVKSIAKSIAKWTYANFTPSKFREIQSARGKIGGKLSKGGGRTSKKAQLLPLVQQQLAQGRSQAEISLDLNISTRTLIRWLS